MALPHQCHTTQPPPPQARPPPWLLADPAMYLLRVLSLSLSPCPLCRPQFLNNGYSAPTAVTSFSAVVTSTATKRAGYSYVNTGSSAWNTIPSTSLFPVETGMVADATLC